MNKVHVITLFRMINLQHIRAHKLRFFLSVLGVSLGVTLIVSVSILNHSVTSSFVELLEALAGKAVIEVSAPSASGLDQSVLIDVVQTEGIKDAIPMVRGYTTLIRGDKEKKVLLLGVPPDVSKIMPAYASEHTTLVEGGVYRAILLPQQLAAALELQLDDPVELLTKDGNQAFTLIGLLPGTDLERINQGDLALMHLPVAQDALGKDGKYDAVYVTLKQGFDTDATIERLRAALGDTVVVGRPSFRGKSIENIWQGLQDTLSVVSVIALFVGTFLVYNTVSVAVAERRWEMGFLRALGLARRETVYLFMIEAALVGCVGAVVGVLMGILVARPLVAVTAGYISSSYPLESARVHLSYSSLVVAPLTGLVSSLAATYIPVRQLLTLSPTEALQFRGTIETAKNRRNLSVPVGGGLAVTGVAAGLGYLFLVSEIYVLGFALLAVLLGSVLLTWRFVAHCLRPVRRIFAKLGGVMGLLAVDRLAKSPQRTSVTVGALMISLAMVVALGGTTDSFAFSVHRSMDLVLAGDIYVESKTWRHSGSDFPLDTSLGRELEEIEGVDLAAPLRFAMCDWQDQQVVLSASDPEKERQFAHLPLETGDEQEIWSELSKGDRALVSGYMLDRFGLQVGDEIELESPTGPHRFQIVGVVNTYSLGQGFVSISRMDLLKYWHDQGVDQFAIVVEEGAAVDRVRDEIVGRITSDKQLVVRTREEKRAQTDELANNFLHLFDGLEAIVVVVAGLGTFNTLFVSVLSEAREIGILRAVGMTRKQTRTMILYEALAMGLIGGGLGVALGLLLFPLTAQAVRPATGFAIEYAFPSGPIISACFIAILVPLCAVLYPSRRAAATNIVQVLQYE